MTPTSHPYTTYHPSDVPWLGDVPAHWDVRRGKALLVPVDVRSTTGDEELLTVSAQRGVIPRETANVTMFKAESYVGYKLCWPGDLVINSLWAWAHGLGVSQHHGIVSSAYGVYRPLPKADARFIHLLVRSIPFQWELQVRSKGIWLSRLQLTDEAFLGAPFPLPPLPEQAAIVRYLDYVNRRLRRYVAAKRKLIALLEEERQAIVNRAVTRGLDPNVRLKPSGVEWLGDVPEHWEVRRLKSMARIRYGLGQPPPESPDGLPLIRATNITRGIISEKDLIFVDPKGIPPGRDATLRSGEIIVVRSGAYTADSSIIPEEYAGAISGYDMVVTAARARPEFIALGLLSTYVRDDQLIVASSRAAQPHLNAEELGNAMFLVPPLAEQAAIVEYLDKATADIDAAITRARRHIELLEEYRTRLIADVVTGKLDVREAAGGLPDEDNEAEPIGENGPLADGQPGDLYSIDESVEDLVMEEEVTA